MAKWDWYEATFHQHSPEVIIDAIRSSEPFAVMLPCRAKHGYRTGVQFKHGQDVLAEVWWEGNPGVHVKASSSRAQWLAGVIRPLGAHSVTRVDACEDWIEAGLFDRITVPLLAYAVQHGIEINQQGDWERGIARTLYLGSTKSAVRLVIYEKGYEIGIEHGGDPGHVRMEVRVRPKGQAREAVSRWTPGEAFGAARWLTEALSLLGWDHLQAQSVGTVYRPSDDERARRTAAKQYGRVFAQWVADCRSVEEFAEELLHLVADNNDSPDVLWLLATAGIAPADR